MKILTYKVPIKLTRVAGEVQIETMDDQKVLQAGLTEDLSNTASNSIPTIAKNINDENNKERTLKLGSLLPSENKAEGFINVRILT